MKKKLMKKVLNLSSETLCDLEKKEAPAVGNAPCTGLTGRHSCCP